jgi:hypothetical protein
MQDAQDLQEFRMEEGEAVPGGGGIGHFVARLASAQSWGHF